MMTVETTEIKSSQTRWRAILVMVLIGLLLISCSGASPTVTPADEPHASATVTVAPTPSPSPLPTATALPSATPSTTPIPPTPTPAATATATDTPTPQAVVFAVIGDYGLAGTPAAEVAALIDSWQPDFIITTGDNNYPNGDRETIDENIGQYYADYIFPYDGAYDSSEGQDVNRFFPTIGNHDYGVEDIDPYLDYFTLPGNERYYEVEWWPVHLFAVNNNWAEPDGVREDSIQGQWLQTALAEATAPWKIVYMHVPPYSSGRHGSNPVSRWPYGEWGASAVLAGHDHTYERLVVDGLPYFVNGVGGYPAIYPFAEIHPASQARFNEDYGAMRVEATEANITFEFITRAGEQIDSFTLPADE